MSNDNLINIHTYNSEPVDPKVVEIIEGQKLSYTRPALVKGDLCKYFCKGNKCKYCVWTNEFSESQAAIPGLYSSWITDNILAMARPNNKILEKFQKLGIKTVINLQTPGEHSSCGYGIVENSEFSYDPSLLMNLQIDYFNYPCEDFSVISINHLLDLVHAIQHRLTMGKVAVHCHAGLGRTGVVIGCYLVFNNRMNPQDVINYIRNKRPKSIQNSVQVNQIIGFANYLAPMRTIFYIESENYKFSLQESIFRQRNFIHGKESYLCHHVPKIIFLSLCRITQIIVSRSKERLESTLSSYSSEVSSLEDYPTSDVRLSHLFRWINKLKNIFSEQFSRKACQKLIRYFREPYANIDIIKKFKNEINKSDECWQTLQKSNDMHMLCQLVKDWFLDLKCPVLRLLDFQILKECNSADNIASFLKLESIVARTTILIVVFINQFNQIDLTQEYNELSRLMLALLTHNIDDLFPNGDTIDSTNSQQHSSALNYSLFDKNEYNEIFKKFIDIKIDFPICN